VIEDQ